MTNKALDNLTAADLGHQFSSQKFLYVGDIGLIDHFSLNVDSPRESYIPVSKHLKSTDKTMKSARKG